MLHVATRTILGGRDPAKMKKRESSYFIFVFALMINFKFFACEPRVYYPLRNPYYIDDCFITKTFIQCQIFKKAYLQDLNSSSQLNLLKICSFV